MPPRAARQSLYWWRLDTSPSGSRMNKKKRRKRRAEKKKSDEKKTTPPQPSDIASVKPDAHEPWCRNCRAHTHYTTTVDTIALSDGSRRQEQTHWCLHCEGVMVIPAQNSGVIIGCGFACGTIGFLFLLLMMIPLGSASPFHRLGQRVLFCGSFIAWPALTYFAWRYFHRKISIYRHWSQWAKEQKGNEAQ